MGDGLAKARETASKFKEEVKEQEEKAVAVKEDVKSQLAALAENPELAALYKQNAKVGSENLGGNAPYLRIHTANSTSNELPDGTFPKDGNFFYAPTKQQFPEVTCHILTVSRGFKVWQEDKKTSTKKLQYNQIVGGVLVDDGELKPFLWYINGLKCQPLWKFGKEISQYTRSGIPMFAMVVQLKTEQVKSDYGMKWVPVFELAKEEGQPQLVLDVELFNMLRIQAENLENNINSLIQTKASEDTIESAQVQENNSPEDIPFS